MKVLGTLLDGDAVRYPGGGSLASGVQGVDDDGRVNLVACECSLIRANGNQGNTCWGTFHLAKIRTVVDWRHVHHR